MLSICGIKVYGYRSAIGSTGENFVGFGDQISITNLKLYALNKTSGMVDIY